MGCGRQRGSRPQGWRGHLCGTGTPAGLPRAAPTARVPSPGSTEPSPPGHGCVGRPQPCGSVRNGFSVRVTEQEPLRAPRACLLWPCEYPFTSGCWFPKPCPALCPVPCALCPALRSPWPPSPACGDRHVATVRTAVRSLVAEPRRGIHTAGHPLSHTNQTRMRSGMVKYRCAPKRCVAGVRCSSAFGFSVLRLLCWISSMFVHTHGDWTHETDAKQGVLPAERSSSPVDPVCVRLRAAATAIVTA